MSHFVLCFYFCLFIYLLVSVSKCKFQTAASRIFWYPGFEVACPPSQRLFLNAIACRAIPQERIQIQIWNCKIPFSTSVSFLASPYLFLFCFVLIDFQSVAKPYRLLVYHISKCHWILQRCIPSFHSAFLWCSSFFFFFPILIQLTQTYTKVPSN